MYLKIFNDEENHNGFQYKTGLNVDTVPFNDDPNASCVRGGLYFSDENHICKFLSYGCYIREVEIPDGESIIKDGNKFRSHSLILKKRRDLRKQSTWKWMIDNGVNVTAYDNYAIRWASQNGYTEVVNLLIEAGADVTAYDNYAIQLASFYGHTDVVKLLIEAGADVTAENNYAIRRASENGHTEVVKLLIEAGADVTANDNDAIRWASENGHTEVVKLLKKHGVKLLKKHGASL